MAAFARPLDRRLSTTDRLCLREHRAFDSFVTDAAHHEGSQFDAVPDPETPPAAYGLTHHARQCHEGASARARFLLEHLFATEKRPTGSMVRAESATKNIKHVRHCIDHRQPQYRQRS
jgi:hypothetical protein